MDANLQAMSAMVRACRLLAIFLTLALAHVGVAYAQEPTWAIEASAIAESGEEGGSSCADEPCAQEHVIDGIMAAAILPASAARQGHDDASPAHLMIEKPRAPLLRPPRRIL